MAKLKRKRLGLIFAGGTTLSTDPKRWERVASKGDMPDWLDHVPELHVVADIEPVFVTGKPATEIGGPEWLAMAEAVRDHIDRVDGFVILHGLETIHYSANALALMLQHLPVPVVFSASPIPRKETSVAQAEFGARANIINAAQVATSGGSGVVVVFGNRIIQGSRAQIELIAGGLQVTSIDGGLMGQLDFGTKLYPVAPRRQSKPVYRIALDPNVLVTTVMPGTSPAASDQSVLGKVRGVVLRMHQGYFALSDAFQRLMADRAGRGLVVVVASPSPIGSVPKFFIPLVGVSGSMAAVKTMWALGVTKGDVRATRKLLLADVAGEFVRTGGTR